jgi:hypothetical protein
MSRVKARHVESEQPKQDLLSFTLVEVTERLEDALRNVRSNLNELQRVEGRAAPVKPASKRTKRIMGKGRDTR